MTPATKGLYLGLLSQILFSVLYLFSLWMAPLSGTDVFALRMLVMLAGVLAILLSSVGLYRVVRFFSKNSAATSNNGRICWWAPRLSPASSGCLCGRR